MSTSSVRGRSINGVVAWLGFFAGGAALLGQVSNSVSPRLVLASRVSLQDSTDSTRASIKSVDGGVQAIIFLPSGERLKFEVGSGSDDQPQLTVKRDGEPDAGALRIAFPKRKPPVLQQLAADGSVSWSAGPPHE